jgi:large subunit ribosomal protein L9
MKVVLRSDVDGVGRKGDIREVSNGYARNFLLPKGLALKATPGVEAQAEGMRRARALKLQTEIADAREVASRLGSANVRLAARAGKEGKLFGSVGAADIVAAIEKQFGATLDRRGIKLVEPIKSIGSHAVSVAVHPEVVIDVTVEVRAG